MSEVLQARTQRAMYIHQLAQQGQVIAIRANSPNGYKNHWTANLLVRLFEREMLQQLCQHSKCGQHMTQQHQRQQHSTQPSCSCNCNQAQCSNATRLEGADGSCVIMLSQLPAQQLKQLAQHLEQTHCLGRLIDIDVYDSKGKLSRTALRKCYLCQLPAAVCVRNATHSVEDVGSYIIDKVNVFLTNQVQNAFLSAVQQELAVPNKFGAVDNGSQGAHSDMNSQLMTASAIAIAPYMTEMFSVGLQSQNAQTAFLTARRIGIEAEHAMLSASRGVNTYKGLIFCAGLVLLAIGNAVNNNASVHTVWTTVGQLASTTIAELDNATTSGANAYKQGYQSARQHAAQGLPSVQRALDVLNTLPHTPDSLTKVLQQIIGDIDDTVLVKRAKDKQRYQMFKQMIVNAKPHEYQQVTQLCIDNNISCGGACDLLVTALLMHNLQWLLQ